MTTLFHALLSNLFLVGFIAIIFLFQNIDSIVSKFTGAPKEKPVRPKKCGGPRPQGAQRPQKQRQEEGFSAITNAQRSDGGGTSSTTGTSTNTSTNTSATPLVLNTTTAGATPFTCEPGFEICAGLKLPDGIPDDMMIVAERWALPKLNDDPIGIREFMGNSLAAVASATNTITGAVGGIPGSAAIGAAATVATGGLGGVATGVLASAGAISGALGTTSTRAKCVEQTKLQSPTIPSGTSISHCFGEYIGPATPSERMYGVPDKTVPAQYPFRVRRVLVKKTGVITTTPGPKLSAEDISGMLCCFSDNPYIGVTKEGSMSEPAEFYIPVERTTGLDVYYEEYDSNEYLAQKKEEDDLAAILPIKEPEFGNVGYTIGSFDTAVTEIPWDYENASLNKSEVVWGEVNPEASKSIFMRVYNQKLLSNKSQLNITEDGKANYQSLFTGIIIDDQKLAKKVGAAEQVALGIIPMLVNPIQNKLWDAVEGRLKNIAAGSPTKATQRLVAQTGRRRLAVKPSVLKRFLGATGFTKFSKMISNLTAKFFRKMLQTKIMQFIIRAVTMLATQLGITIASAAASAGTCPFCGCCLVPIATLAANLMAAISTFISAATPFVMAICIIVGPILEKTVDSAGVCPPQSTSIKKFVPQVAETIISIFVPVIGDIFDLFYPYICIKGAEPKFKVRLRTQPYVDDSTLSASHAFNPDPMGADEDHVNHVGYLQPALNNLPYSWCNFANPIMLDRMAQFYYRQSLLHPFYDEDGRVCYQYIVEFYGVIASSELSCDVACKMKTICYEEFTGKNYFESYYCDIFDPQPGAYPVCHRRFYFTRNLETDPMGIYTVVGCTNQNYTAPMAEATSSGGGEYVPSLPKFFEPQYKDPLSNTGAVWSSIGVGVALGAGMALLGQGAARGAAAVRNRSSRLQARSLGMMDNNRRFRDIPLGDRPLPSRGAGRSALVVEFAGNFAAAAIPVTLQNSITELDKRLGILPLDDAPGTTIEGNPAEGYTYVTNNSYWKIYRGAIIEDTAGYTPYLQFCKDLEIPLGTCKDKTVVRDTIDRYQSLNPNKHVKILKSIEPRKNGACYYKWSEVGYDPEENIEESLQKDKEILVKYKIKDNAMCLFVRDETFTKNGADKANEFIEATPANLTTNYPVFSIVNPLSKEARQQLPSFPKDVIPAGNPLKNDILFPTRKQVENTSGPAPMPTETKFPYNPFPVPRALPKNTYLGFKDSDCETTSSDIINCVIRCKTECGDKAVIDKLTKQFNNANRANGRQIMKVLKAWTPKPDRCDYDVQMMRTYTVDPKTKAVVPASTPNTSKHTVLQRETVKIIVRENPTGSCQFERVSDGSAALNSGTFIQNNTPDLSGVDTSGGVTYFNQVVKSIKSAYNALIGPLVQEKILDKSFDSARRAYDASDKALEKVFTNITLQGCPEKKCNEPDIMQMALNHFNEKNGFVIDQYGTYTDTRATSVAKAGVASGDQCDMMLKVRVDTYGNYLDKPVDQSTRFKPLRFNLKYQGRDTNNNCQFALNPSSSGKAYQDVSSTAIGMRYESATVSPEFEPDVFTVDCTSKDTLNMMKTGLETIVNARKDPVTGDVKYMHSFTSVTKTFQPEPTKCMYETRKTIWDLKKNKSLKCVSGYDDTTGNKLYEKCEGQVSYVTADFRPSPTRPGQAEIVNVKEYEENTIRYDDVTGTATDPVSGDILYRQGRAGPAPAISFIDKIPLVYMNSKQQNRRVSTRIFPLPAK